MGRLDISKIVIGRKKFTIPFKIPLVNAVKPLQCNKLLRFIPGSRAVFSGLWGETRVVAKLFFKPFRYKKHAKKEITGNELLKKASIPTSSILYSGFSKELQSHILIFEFIESSINFGEMVAFNPHVKSGDLKDAGLQKLTQSLKDTHGKYLTLLVKLIAKMHQNGLIHNDLHPGNFLLKDDTIYVLDGASIRQASATRPLQKKNSLENLSILLSQINLQDKRLFNEFVRAYAGSRNYHNADQVKYILEKFIAKSHRLRTARYLKKIYRSSTQIICRKSFSSFMLCHREYYTAEMKSFLQNPDIAFQNSDTKFLKTGKKTTLILHKIDGVEFVVKRYNMKNILYALRRAFKKSRADISWYSSHLLIRNRINTPKPAAIKEVRFGPFRNKAFFICEYIKGESARHLFNDAKADDVKIPAESVIDGFYKFKSSMISHGDMKATNIIIKDNLSFFIDLDSMKWHKSRFGFARACKKDMKRFMKNWENNPQISKLFNNLQQ